MLDYDNNFYLISLGILITCLLNNLWIIIQRSCILMILPVYYIDDILNGKYKQVSLLFP